MSRGRLMIALWALGGCTPYDPKLPPSPFLCGSVDPKCPDGYTCVVAGGKSVCMDSTPAGQVDAPPSGSCATPFTGVLASWNLAGETGSQASTMGTANAPGVTVGMLTRAPALIPTSGTGSMNSTNWPLGSQLDPMSFYTISLAPPAGCTLAVTSLALDAKASGTGPASAAVGTMADAFASTAPGSTSAPSTPTLSASVASGSLEIRIFGFGATAASGTLRIQNALSVSGALQ